MISQEMLLPLNIHSPVLLQALLASFFVSSVFSPLVDCTLLLLLAIEEPHLGYSAYTNGSLVTYHALQLMQPGNLTLPMTMRSLSQTVAHAVGEKAIAAGGFAHFLRACTYTAASSSSDQDIAADMTIVDRGYRTVNSLAVARRSHAGAGLRALGGVWIFAGGTYVLLDFVCTQSHRSQ